MDCGLNDRQRRSETLLFLKRMVAHPLQIGAFFPSSRNLSRVIAGEAVRCLRDLSCDYVLELGCGTGRFTRALIEAGIPEENLVCVEIDGELFNYLAGEFKKARVIRGNACDMMSIIPGELIGKIGVVVSGIPMINLPHVVQKAIVDGCMNVMRPRGEIIQFTYSPLASLNTSLLGLRKRKVATVFRNFPPATVWAYERAPSVNSL